MVSLCSGQNTVSSMFLPVVSPCSFSLWFLPPSLLVYVAEWVLLRLSQKDNFIFCSLVNFSVVYYCYTNASSCLSLFLCRQLRARMG